MIRKYCDLCGQENTDNSLSKEHWCGNFVIDQVRAEVEMTFMAELCHECRERFATELLARTELDGWVPMLHP